MKPLPNHPFGILMYHRVARHVRGVGRPTWNVTPERFRRQLQGLLRRGYQAWPLRRALECRRAGVPIPPRVFVVTFDDGYASVFENAWPILKELRVPATVFVATAYLDTQERLPFDDWSRAGSQEAPPSLWRALSTSECLRTIEDGLIEIGSHTHTHVDFRTGGQLDCVKFQADLLQSRQVLRERFGLDYMPFAFPYGYFNDGMVEAARQAGMSCALTAEKELVGPDDDPFSWARFEVKGSDTPGIVVMKLNGSYTLLRKTWKRLQASLTWKKTPLMVCST